MNDEVPRYELTNKIRQHLPRPTTDAEALLAVYQALNQRDRAVVYRVALALAEHAAETIE